MAGGRPSLIKEWTTPENLIRIEGWARDGLTNEQIAKNIGVCVATFYEWRNKNAELVKALKKGKEVVDREVENALYKRAIGFHYEETVTEIYEEADGTKRKHVKNFRKYSPPDTTAQIFWLKNRKINEWRDKREVTNDTEALNKLDGILNGIVNKAKQEAE